MNRVLLFRVWDAGTKTMHPRAFELLQNKQPPVPKIHTGKISDPKNWTWLQYTGLKDKNGVEIYEGDIVSHKIINEHNMLIDEVAKVIYYRAGFFTECGAIADMATQAPDRDFEVIGNIYENKELLK